MIIKGYLTGVGCPLRPECLISFFCGCNFCYCCPGTALVIIPACKGIAGFRPVYWQNGTDSICVGIKVCAALSSVGMQGYTIGLQRNRKGNLRCCPSNRQLCCCRSGIDVILIANQSIIRLIAILLCPVTAVNDLHRRNRASRIIQVCPSLMESVAVADTSWHAHVCVSTASLAV